nr:histone-lysine N-methyltransferase SETMAR-like [Megalopta genalis]
MLWEFKLGNSSVQTAIKICNVYGVDTVTDRTVRRWFKKFRSGDTSLKEEPRLGRPSDFDKDVLNELLEQNPRQTTKELAEKLKVSQSTIIRQLHALGKVSKLGVWVHRQLSDQNKAQRMSIATSLISRYKIEPFLDKIVTGSEKWIRYEAIVRKRQLSDGNEKVTNVEPKTKYHGRKILLCIWWGCSGIIHFELLNRNNTVTPEIYVNQLERVQKKLQEKHPSLIEQKNVILLHDNDKLHSEKVTQQKILELGWSILPYPSCSSDLVPTDYYLFRLLQKAFDGESFKNTDQINKCVSNFFDSKYPDFYTHGIKQLPHRWQQVIDNNGDYILD